MEVVNKAGEITKSILLAIPSLAILFSPFPWPFCSHLSPDHFFSPFSWPFRSHIFPWPFLFKLFLDHFLFHVFRGRFFLIFSLAWIMLLLSFPVIDFQTPFPAHFP